jgi:hypothetical protein
MLFLLKKDGTIDVLRDKDLKNKKKIKLNVKANIISDFQIIGKYIYISQGGETPVIKRFLRNGRQDKSWVVCSEEKKRILRCAFSLQRDKNNYLYGITPKYIIKYDISGKEIERTDFREFKKWPKLTRIRIGENGDIYVFYEKEKKVIKYNPKDRTKKEISLEGVDIGSILRYRILDNKIYYMTWLKTKCIVGRFDMKTRKNEVYLSGRLDTCCYIEFPLLIEVARNSKGIKLYLIVLRWEGDLGRDRIVKTEGFIRVYQVLNEKREEK